LTLTIHNVTIVIETMRGEIMKIKIDIPCPYCHHQNTLNLNPADVQSGHHLMSCDCENGGCDKLFVYHIPWDISILAGIKKVEGE
jgi:hypothetical protein